MKQLFWLVLLLGFSAVARAGGFQIPLEGQKQVGMASTGTALIFDASTLFYNPGGLSFTQHSQISASAWFLLPKVQFLGAGTNTVWSTQSKPVFPFTFYASYSPKPTDKWKIGIGVYEPYGAIINWPSYWAGRYVLEKANLTTVNIQPTFSYKIANKVGIGASVVYSLGSVDLVRGVPLQDTLGNTGTAELKGRASGVGFNVGVYYEITKKVSIGLSYKHKITYSPKNGSATFTVPSALKDSFVNTGISTSLSVPYELDAGVSYKPVPKALIAFDVNYTGWHVFNVLDIHFAQTNTVVTDIILPRHFNNSFTFRLGGQYAIDSTFTIRAGTFLDFSPVPDGFVPPEVPDANRYGVTAGLSILRGHFELDISLSYLETVARTETGNYAALNGMYRSNAITAGLGINYNFYKNKKKQSVEPGEIH